MLTWIVVHVKIACILLMVGGLFYVDDLALCSTDPQELQEMIDVVQNWSERSRLSVNADKSKIMAFHETPSQKATRASPDLFHLLSAFPSPTRHTLEEVESFDYLGLRFDSKLLMHKAVELILEKVDSAHNIVAATARSLRYDRHHSNPTLSCSPSHLLQLWKSNVLPQFNNYLRYIPLDTQVRKLQSALNSSLCRTLRVYGHAVALLADTGLPPLVWVQQVQLAQLQYRLRNSPANRIPYALHHMWRTAWSANLPDKSLESRMSQAVTALDPLRLPLDSPLPPSVRSALPKNRERSYRNWLQKQASAAWLQELHAELSASPSRLRTYVTLHLHPPIRRSLFKAAPYLRAQAPNLLALLRLRTQSSVDWIPAHTHFSRVGHRPDYVDRHCRLCPGSLGDELHMITACPTFHEVAERHHPTFLSLFRLCDIPSFSHLTPLERVRAMLGNPPTALLRKNIRQWLNSAPASCARFSHDLLTSISAEFPRLTLHPNPFHLDPADDEPSDDEDEFHPLDCPPGLLPDPTPTDDQPLEPLHPSGQTLIGRTIFFNWPAVGWCPGNITERNLNARLKVGGRVANFKVSYPCDSTTATHSLHLDSYNHHHNGLAPYYSWVFLSPAPPPGAASDTGAPRAAADPNTP